MASTAATTAVSVPAGTGVLSQVVPAVLAMLLGMMVVGVAGFSHIDAVHNASHDTRHSNGFPCH